MFYVGTLLFSSPLGWLSDTIGRKPVMVDRSRPVRRRDAAVHDDADPLLVHRSSACSRASARRPFGPAGQAFVADITTEHNRSKAYGLLTTAQFGGLIVGPALAAPLYHLVGERHGRLLRDLLRRGRLLGASLVAVWRFVREPAALRPARAAPQGIEPPGGTGKAVRPPYRARSSRRPSSPSSSSPSRRHFAMGAFDVVWSLWLKHLGASMSLHRPHVDRLQRADAALVRRRHPGRPATAASR